MMDYIRLEGVWARAQHSYSVCRKPDNNLQKIGEWMESASEKTSPVFPAKETEGLRRGLSRGFLRSTPHPVTGFFAGYYVIGIAS